MKNYAKPMLEAVPEENARRSELLDLIHGLTISSPLTPTWCPGLPHPGVYWGGDLRI
ncbi:MAG: hypothetical protein ACLR6W_12130 [Evtepia sp.]